MNWQRVYNELMARAQERGTVQGYSERHHVVPKAHGGSDHADNLVQLTAREHFLAHWVLWRIHRDRATARAFRLLTDVSGRPRSRSYEKAKTTYAQSMVGDLNVAKRPEVRAKISAALKANHPYTGIKRPKHAELLRVRGGWSGNKNPWYGTGKRQVGTANHMARSVTGFHPERGVVLWGTATDAALDLGVSVQAVVQAIKKYNRSRGWDLEYTT